MRYASEKPDSFFKLDISESDWANSIELLFSMTCEKELTRALKYLY
jgi:hypothetical protein